MQGDGVGRKLPDAIGDGELWRRSRITDAADDDAERYLDLATYADGLLDEDDRARVALWLADDPGAASDVAAAQSLREAGWPPEAAPDQVIARACGLVGGGAGEPDNVVPFRPRPRYIPRLDRLARWSSLAAAMAVASWLGLTLGMDASRSLAQLGQNGDETFLHELLDPSTGFLRDLSEGNST